MFGSTIIDVVIGLSFIYILLSLVCASLGELISGTFLNYRAKDLERGIEGLLRDSSLVEQFYDHPVIRSLSVNKQRPDYIPSHTFALVLVDFALRDTHHSKIDTSDRHSIRRLIQELPPDSALPDPLRRTLLDLCDESGGNLSGLREAVAQWYNDCMDRVSGAYKRRVQLMIVIAAAAITAGVNADTIGMARGIWNAPFLRETLSEQERVSNLRDNVAEQATSYSRQSAQAPAATPRDEPSPEPTFSANANAERPTPDVTTGSAAPANSSGAVTPAPTATPTSFYYLDTPLSARQRLARLAETTGFPLGWSSDPIANDPRGVPTDLAGWLLKACGWLLTILVVTFGAPMWFDLLNRFAVVRSTVKPREKHRAQPPKDKAEHAP